MEDCLFKDYFSVSAADYAHYRPTYPNQLFEFLAKQCPHHDLAWDCATGSGQAAVLLAPYFKRVVASDASSQQIIFAVPKENIRYCIMPAEKTDFLSQSIDLITVAQALHWFDFNIFYPEVKRILKPEGIIAAWSYGLVKINSEIDALIKYFYQELTGPYWPEERRYIDHKYQDIPFPFQKIATPTFSMQQTWTLNHFIGYLSTWSAVRKYQEETNQNPLELIIEPLKGLWGNPEEKLKIEWPIYLLVGKQE